MEDWKIKRITSICMAVLMIALAALAFTGGLAGASAQNNINVTGDKTSGAITVYTALEDELVTEYLADFNAKFPNITVNVVRKSTGGITAKLLAEQENPVADAIWDTAGSSLLTLDEKNMLEPYAPAGVEGILANFKSSKAVPTWVGIDAWETAFVINNHLVFIS
ncbi:MAG: hypothetical protein LBU67_05470 [Oscillospiraceae bacterium]|jgi:iron(III) transport system substrate-binding protein|nr:hypothetical protein [Oscillospiraceae bacterium]